MRDTGILHSLLKIETKDSLLSHPILGTSWEGFAIEQIISAAPARSEFSYYRTATGEEIDLIVDSPKAGRIAFEIKRSSVPALGKGFYNALDRIKSQKAFIIYSGDEQYRINDTVSALPLKMVPEAFA